jgi:D-arabinose 1-dehydrogenase-like Zn-dependent alcohol dehydrogenase
MSLADSLAERGEIGGRTVRITESGAVECHVYPLGPLSPAMVRVRTAVSVISPGTEMTYIGRDASNPYLHKTWDPELRVFTPGTPTQDHPIVFGYRAAGTVVASSDMDVPPGTRVYGKWRHTEFTSLSLADARAQRLPAELSFEDGADLAQMLPVAVNAVAYAEERHAGAPAVVFGCGPVGLILAQVVRATGATTVYAVDRITQRLAIAKSLGLVPVDAAGEDVARKLKREHGPDGIPVAFECSGNARALHEAVRAVRRRGTVVAVGFYQGEASGLFLGDEFHHNGVEIRSGQIGNIHPRWQIGTLRAFGIDIARRGQVVLGKLPRSAYRVEQAAEAFESLKRPGEVLQAALSY